MRLIDTCDASMDLSVRDYPGNHETYHLFLKRSIRLRLSLCLFLCSLLLEFSLCLQAERSDL